MNLLTLDEELRKRLLLMQQNSYSSPKVAIQESRIKIKKSQRPKFSLPSIKDPYNIKGAITSTFTKSKKPIAIPIKDSQGLDFFEKAAIAEEVYGKTKNAFLWGLGQGIATGPTTAPAGFFLGYTTASAEEHLTDTIGTALLGDKYKYIDWAI